MSFRRAASAGVGTGRRHLLGDGRSSRQPYCWKYAMRLNLAECFFQKAEEQPDHPLVLDHGDQEAGDQTSYADFQAEVQSLAEMLKQAGVRRGDNVGLLYPSGRVYIAFV